ncbi:MAG: tRNA (adenosine(37)-N6)-threonylcarbamoyltransferase complex transferase subunit TsaD [Chthonomonadales bacterium]|nr:tRNA (adenosine(37)-N6)-threonylcarbamoyltransferase complex transferase subunit TsaD [Chthonomonadales bacterium]
MTTLGLETSCDETSAAVLRNGADVLSSVVASQADLHARWGGVVPEVASRKHVERALPTIFEAIKAAGIGLPDINGIAVTNRPGLIGALVVGVAAAKALAYALDRPLVGVHHLAGHLASCRLADAALTPPFVCLLVSGGHTELALVAEDGALRTLGRTRDDAAGECFDKCARVLGLPYPGGPHIDRLAARGDPLRVAFPRAWLGESLDFSFSGLKTAVLRFAEADGGATPLPDVAASLQAAIVEVLVAKAVRAAREAGVSALAVAGGVAANRGLAAALRTEGGRAGLRVVVPPPDLCTDNAAMIAAAGYPRLAAGVDERMTLDAAASEPLDSRVPLFARAAKGHIPQTASPPLS